MKILLKERWEEEYNLLYPILRIMGFILNRVFQEFKVLTFSRLGVIRIFKISPILKSSM
jgi:hypothetical protein